MCVGFVMCRCVYVWVFLKLCGCFGDMCTCIYCVMYVVTFMYIYIICYD